MMVSPTHVALSLATATVVATIVGAAGGVAIWTGRAFVIRKCDWRLLANTAAVLAFLATYVGTVALTFGIAEALLESGDMSRQWIYVGMPARALPITAALLAFLILAIRFQKSQQRPVV